MEKIKNNLYIIYRVNIILLIAFLVVSLTDSFLQCLSNIYNGLNIVDYISIFIVSFSFIAMYGLILAIFINIIMLICFYIKRIKGFLLFVSTLLLTFLNLVPASLILSGFFIPEGILYYLLNLLISLFVSFTVSFIIIYNYKHLLNILSSQKTSVLLSFFIFIVAVFDISGQLLNKIEEVSLYYFLLSIIIAVFAVCIVSYKTGFKQLDRIHIEYCYLAILVAVIFGSGILSFNQQLQATVKSSNSFTRTAYKYLNVIFDFDRDGFGPQFILTGGDFDNLNPLKNQTSFDYPENGINENNFNGDLLKTYYRKYFRNNKPLQNKKNANIVMITVNNARLPLNLPDDSYTRKLLDASACFPNAYGTSDNKLSILKSFFTSQISNFSILKRDKHVFTPGMPLLKKLQQTGYKTALLLDLPYSSRMDFFDVYNSVDVFFANNYLMKQPVKTLDILRTVLQFEGHPYFIWVLLDTNVPVDYDKRVESLLEGLKKTDPDNDAIVIINFVAQESIYENILDNKVPFAIYYEGIKPHKFNKSVSSNDILPTILSLTGIQYKTGDYLGQDLSPAIIEQKEPAGWPIFITQSDQSVSVILNKKLLRYNLAASYKELYNFKTDDRLQFNVINKKQDKQLFSLMDFIISQGAVK